MKLMLLVNPAAGRGRAGRRVPVIVRTLEHLGFDCEIHLSKGPGHLTEMARRLAPAVQGKGLFAVCGGDGSLNEVLNGIGPSPAPLGLIPCGTGDDVARNIGIPRTVEKACRALLSGKVRTVDLADAGGRLYVGIGGAGIDSEVTRRANASRLPIPGHAVYTWAVLSTLVSFRPFAFTVTADRWKYHGEVMFVAVANAPSYGGGMRLSPHSRMDDGVLEVCIVEKMGRLELLRNFPRLFRGTHLSHPAVRLLTTRRARIESESPLDFYGDGERLQSLPTEVSLLPAALRVIVPDDGGGETLPLELPSLLPA